MPQAPTSPVNYHQHYQSATAMRGVIECISAESASASASTSRSASSSPTMLHCPKCSGQLEVKDRQQQQQQQPTPQCPAGDFCPHQQAAAAAAPPSPPQQQHWNFAASAPPSKTLNYLSGGGVMFSSSSSSPAAASGQKSLQTLQEEALRLQQQQQRMQQQQMQQQHLLLSATSSLPGHPHPSALDQNAALLQNLHLGSSSESLLNSVPAAAASQQQQQQHPHVLFSTRLSPCTVAEQQQQQPPVLNVPVQQQQLLFHQQPPTVMSAGGGGCLHAAMSTAAAPQVIHHHHHLQQLQQQQQQPFLITSTVGQQQPLFQQQQHPRLVISTAGSGLGAAQTFATASAAVPQTPAIVVGPVPPPMWPGERAPISVEMPHVRRNPQQQQFPVSDLHSILSTNKRRLESSGWYYPDLKWDESQELLMKSSPGTFLVRDSADPRFLFSLSVQREEGIEGDGGPTSVRIHFHRGVFRLDAEESIREHMPAFSSVVALMEHYLPKGSDNSKAEKKPMSDSAATKWVDNIGKLSSPICLKRPLYKSVPSLSHFARLAVNKALPTEELEHSEAASKLGAPKKLEEYVRQYPHRV